MIARFYICDKIDTKALPSFISLYGPKLISIAVKALNSVIASGVEKPKQLNEIFRFLFNVRVPWLGKEIKRLLPTRGEHDDIIGRGIARSARGTVGLTETSQ